MFKSLSFVFLVILMLGVKHNALSQKKSKIKLLGADKMIYNEQVHGKVRILRGNVRFKQNQTLMYCDSAVLHGTSNQMKAYGHVKIVDSKKNTTMIGDSLTYNGNKRTGELRGDITLTTDDHILKTRRLDFDTKNNITHYYGGGVTTSKTDNSILKSKIGHYYSRTKTFYFKTDVEYISEEYTMYSDTMEYNTETETVFFHGPTDIIGDSSTIYCESGWLDQRNDVSTFSKNVEMNSDGQTIRGDSIIYNKANKLGWAYGHVEIIDTANKTEVYGDFARYNNRAKTSLVTGSMHLIMAFTKDSLHLHSDTLITDYDVSGKHRLMHAFHHVQFYKSDMQGKCDSLSFSEADSTIRMYETPVVWADSNQITGKEIVIKTYDGEIKNMQIFDQAFIISEEEPGLYNQIKGKSLFAHFRDNDIYQIDVDRSGQTIYYVRDENKDLMGMNRLDCSKMSIFLDSATIDNIKFYQQPDGVFYPMKQLKPSMKLLRFFYWRAEERPVNRAAIFHWTDVPSHVRNRREGK